MSDYTYPSSDLERVDRLLSLLGTFWSMTYGGDTVVSSYAAATAATYQQAYLDLLELVASVSRYKIPVFHTENWTLLTLKSSEKLSSSLVMSTDLSSVYDGDRYYDTYTGGSLYAWELPAGLASAPLLLNRITNSSLTLTAGVDYVVRNGYIAFRDDPFANELIPQRSLLEDGEETDRELGLWVFKGKFDYENVYRQFGYALGFQLQSSEKYKGLMIAVLDALVEGTTVNHLREAWSVITGIPLIAADSETVEEIRTEIDRQVVVTDKNAYYFTLDTTITCSVGQTLLRGDSLCDGMSFHEFNRGQVPDVTELASLAVGNGFVASGYYGPLIFENKDVALVVEEDVDGYTKVSWELGGWPGDVAQFFDELHANGVAAGQTLANLLDVRPVGNRDTEPTAASLPATINPLEFLCQNVLRNNTIVIRIKAAALRDGLGLNTAKVLRKIVPPHATVIVLVELEHTDDPIRMEEAGDAETPGYEESLALYTGMTASETLSTALLSESVTLRQIGGRCI